MGSALATLPKFYNDLKSRFITQEEEKKRKKIIFVW